MRTQWIKLALPNGTVSYVVGDSRVIADSLQQLHGDNCRVQVLREVKS